MTLLKMRCWKSSQRLKNRAFFGILSIDLCNYILYRLGMTGIARASDTFAADPSFFIAMNIKDINALLADLGEPEQKKIKAVIFKEYKSDSITPADVQKVRAAVLEKIANQSGGKSAVKTSGRRAASKSAETETPEEIPVIDSVSYSDIDAEMEDIYKKCAYALDEYTAQLGIEDWKKETLTRWRGACEYIGRVVFKATDLLRDKTRREFSGCTRTNNYMYNRSMMDKLLSYFSELCHRNNKPVMLAHYCDFCGVGYAEYILKSQELSPASLEVLKKSFEMQHSDLTDRAVQGGGVTLIATLNHIHGWDGSQREQKSDNSGSLGVQSLPRLTGGE